MACQNLAQAELDEFKVVTARQLTKVLACDRTQIWRLEKAGKFPRRMKLANQRVVWRWSEVKAWIDNLPRVDDLKTAAE